MMFTLLYFLFHLLTENKSCRAEFGGILFYFYICDRTDVFSDSTKVPLLFPAISFDIHQNIADSIYAYPIKI